MRINRLPDLRGPRVMLRQPVPADVLTRMEIPRDPEEDLMYGGSGDLKVFSQQEATEIFDQYRHLNVQRERRFVIAALARPDGRAANFPGGRCIGGMSLHHIEPNDRRARLAIGIFDRRFWSHGYGSEAIQLLLAYAFDAMHLHRVDLRVLAYNTRAIRAHEKCGFVREGVERESAFVNGLWHDDVMMSILDHEVAARQRA